MYRGGLPGTIISIKDRTDIGVKNSDGTFSFPVKGKRFVVQTVKKSGYTLVDADAVPKTYMHSTNMLYLVMETPEQVTQDKLTSERSIRRTLQRQLQEREDEIEALKAANKISQQEYQKALQKLYADQENNEKLISDMAKRYSELDYDQMDEFYRHVGNFIEQGELTKADSMLRSRGDVGSQIEAELKKGETIRLKKEELQQAETVHKHDIEELANRCFSYFESFKMQHQNDSAAKYIEWRAKLDTTNVEWQNDAGLFIQDYQSRYNDALSYYESGLRLSVVLHDEKSEWMFYNNIGIVYDKMGEYAKALEYHTKALGISDKVLGPEHSDVAKLAIKALEMALSFNNIGIVYDKMGKYAEALEFHTMALAVYEKILGSEHLDVARSNNNIGSVYLLIGDYAKALDYHKKALAIREKILGSEHPDVAESYNNVGVIYNYMGEYVKALECCIKSLDINENIFGSEHPIMATTYGNIGIVFHAMGDYVKALEYHNMALAIREKIFGAEHSNTIMVREHIKHINRLMILSDNEKMQEYIFVSKTVEGDTPAKQQGMSGEYVMLEFADWNIKSMESLFDKSEEMRNHPKTIVVMKGEDISKYDFGDKIGVRFDLKQVGKEEKNRIIKKYESWKKAQKH